MVFLCFSHLGIIDMRKHDIDSANKCTKVPTITRCYAGNGLVSEIIIAAFVFLFKITGIHITFIRTPSVQRSTDGIIRKHFIARPHKSLEVIVGIKCVFFCQVRNRGFFQKAIITTGKADSCDDSQTYK